MNFPGGEQMGMFGLPPLSRSDVQIFTSNTLAQGWQAWNKPQGVTQAFMMAIAGGGGGGGGFTRIAGNAGGGGGGGACSGIARLFIPAFFLPGTLYVQVGQGGLGGAASVNGSAGANSFISYGHSTAAPNVLLASGVNAPGGGTAGTGAAAGGAGTVPTIATVTTTQIVGQWMTVVGLAGVAGGVQTGAIGTSVTAWAALPLSPGAGGAGCTTTNFDGGGVTPTAAVDWGFLNFPNIAGSVALSGAGVAAGTGINGSSGVVSWAPFFMSGGAGGGSSNSGTPLAGCGGNGGIGCGGGGGGAGATTAGRGGNGGNGMVVIISW